MYKKKKTGWLAHLDFKILDVIAMLFVYFGFFVSQGNIEARSLFCGALFLAMFGLLFSIMTNIHDNVIHRRPIQEFILSMVYVPLCEGATIVYMIFLQKNELYALNMWMFIIFGIMLDFVVKLIYKWIIKKGLTSYTRKSKLVIVASDSSIFETLDRLELHSFGQFEIDGIVIYNSQKFKVDDRIRGHKFICELEDLPEFIQRKWLDEVLINLPKQRVPRDILDKLNEMGVATHRVIEFGFENDKSKVVERIVDYTCLTESVRIIDAQQFVAKRAMDILGGLIGSLLTIVLTIFIGPLIFLTDPGPIFFSQPRIGKGGRIFKMLKFRSMYKDAEARKAELMDKNQISDGMMFKMDNDPRILGSGPDGKRKGIGWFIRKFSIDEFPQFFMVLKGDMSLVGTRPPTLDEWEKYGSAHRARMAIRPGITGMWQANGRSEITDFEKVVALDMEYIRNMSFTFDILLILKTIKNMFTGSGAK